MRDYKRRQFLVDKSYQVRIISRIILICFAGLVVDLAVFNVLAYMNIEAMRWKTHVQVETVNDIVWSYMVYASVISMLFTVAVLFLYIRVMRRQTAGPLFRLHKDIGSAAEGNLSLDIYLRGGDDFKETATELNAMISSIRSYFRSLSEKFAAIEKTVNVFEYVADKPEIALQKCQQLIDYLEPLQKGRR
jgi:methyl-accepting chemotaxis protein